MISQITVFQNLQNYNSLDLPWDPDPPLDDKLHTLILSWDLNTTILLILPWTQTLKLLILPWGSNSPLISQINNPDLP